MGNNPIHFKLVLPLILKYTKKEISKNQEAVIGTHNFRHIKCEIL